MLPCAGMRVFRLTVVAAVAAFATMLPGLEGTAQADEPVSALEPRLLNETGENTTVIDAFDKDDPFDANLLLTFHQQWKAREHPPRDVALAGCPLERRLRLAQRERRELQPERDAPSRSAPTSGSSATSRCRSACRSSSPTRRSSATSTARPGIRSGSRTPTGDQLFNVPFKSPTRSGVDWFGVALNYGILNQVRDPSYPTWVIGAESRFSRRPAPARLQRQRAHPVSGPGESRPARAATPASRAA